MKSVADILKEIRPEFDFTASNDFHRGRDARLI